MATVSDSNTRPHGYVPVRGKKHCSSPQNPVYILQDILTTCPEIPWLEPVLMILQHQKLNPKLKSSPLHRGGKKQPSVSRRR
ncbi:hypothetical protein Dimus_035940 [Dionaea muscipula]